MLLNLRKILRSEQFQQDYIKVFDMEAIIEKYPQCDTKILDVILNNSETNADSCVLKKNRPKARLLY
jgi:hypothetical protein